jgi:hypothetical protein
MQGPVHNKYNTKPPTQWSAVCYSLVSPYYTCLQYPTNQISLSVAGLYQRKAPTKTVGASLHVLECQVVAVAVAAFARGVGGDTIAKYGVKSISTSL